MRWRGEKAAADIINKTIFSPVNKFIDRREQILGNSEKYSLLKTTNMINNVRKCNSLSAS